MTRCTDRERNKDAGEQLVAFMIYALSAAIQLIALLSGGPTFITANTRADILYFLLGEGCHFIQKNPRRQYSNPGHRENDPYEHLHK